MSRTNNKARDFPACLNSGAGFCLCSLTNIILTSMFCFRAKIVPENILKKQQRDAKLMKELADTRAAEKKARAASRTVAAANAVKYAAEYAKADKDVVDAKRAAKKAGNFYVDAQAKIAFVVRTRG